MITAIEDRLECDNHIILAPRLDESATPKCVKLFLTQCQSKMGIYLVNGLSELKVPNPARFVDQCVQQTWEVKYFGYLCKNNELVLASSPYVGLCAAFRALFTVNCKKDGFRYYSVDKDNVYLIGEGLTNKQGLQDRSLVIHVSNTGETATATCMLVKCKRNAETEEEIETGKKDEGMEVEIQHYCRKICDHMFQELLLDMQREEPARVMGGPESREDRKAPSEASGGHDGSSRRKAICIN